MTLTLGNSHLWQMLVSGSSGGTSQLLAFLGSLMMHSVIYAIVSIVLAVPVYTYVRRVAARRSAGA